MCGIAGFFLNGKEASRPLLERMNALIMHRGLDEDGFFIAWRRGTDREGEVRAVLGRIEAAWKEKRFEGLDECFDEKAVIVGPNYAVFASGRTACAESYREFAANAAVLSYSESDHVLRLWEGTVVYTFSWRMTYQRDNGPKAEFGTDQLVLALNQSTWRVLFRYIYFAPST